MLEDNIKIERGRGEYKDFPYKYTLYLYEKAVWTDDFNEELNDRQVVEAFIKDLKYVIDGWGI